MGEKNVTKDKIASAATTRAVVETDGAGQVRTAVGRDDTSAVSAAALDILGATIRASAAKLGLSGFRDAVITFDDGVLVLGSPSDAGMFAVLAEDQASAGLLLNQVRRALALDAQSERGGGA